MLWLLLSMHENILHPADKIVSRLDVMQGRIQDFLKGGVVVRVVWAPSDVTVRHSSDVHSPCICACLCPFLNYM